MDVRIALATLALLPVFPMYPATICVEILTQYFGEVYT